MGAGTSWPGDLQVVPARLFTCQVPPFHLSTMVTVLECVLFGPTSGNATAQLPEHLTFA